MHGASWLSFFWKAWLTRMWVLHEDRWLKIWHDMYISSSRGEDLIHSKRYPFNLDYPFNLNSEVWVSFSFWIDRTSVQVQNWQREQTDSKADFLDSEGAVSEYWLILVLKQDQQFPWEETSLILRNNEENKRPQRLTCYVVLIRDTVLSLFDWS